jgi:hypothetical protein
MVKLAVVGVTGFGIDHRGTKPSVAAGRRERYHTRRIGVPLRVDARS